MFSSSLQPLSLLPFPRWFLLTWQFFQLKLELVPGQPLPLPLLSSLLLHSQCVRWHHRWCDHFYAHFHRFRSHHFYGHRFLFSLLRFCVLLCRFHFRYARYFLPSSLRFLQQSLESPRWWSPRQDCNVNIHYYGYTHLIYKY